jgi:hypothetical protein
MRDPQPYSKVIADIREKFLMDAGSLCFESRQGVCDRLTPSPDRDEVLTNFYKVASEGFTEWTENLGKFAAGHVATLGRMASGHAEWDIADPSEWARIQVAEFVDDHLYPKRCQKCWKLRSEHSGANHEFSKAMSQIELWWRVASGEELDFDLHKHGRPERWSAPVWIRKNPEKSDRFLRDRSFLFEERLKWMLHDAERDTRIDLALVPLPLGNGSQASSRQSPAGTKDGDKAAAPASPANTDASAASPKAAPAPSVSVKRAMTVEIIRREITEITGALELTEDYDIRVRDNAAFAGYITVVVCNRHSDLCDKLSAINTTSKPVIIRLASEIASRSAENPNSLRPNTFRDAHKRHGSEARMLLDQRQ